MSWRSEVYNRVVEGSRAETIGRREVRRALHQEVSRAQILDAAEEIFASKGYHEATIKEIAQLAEFSVGAVYSFFETKDDLFVQIFLRRGVEFMEGMRAVMKQKARPRELMHRLADYQIEFFRRHPNFGRLYLRSSAVALGDMESKLNQLVSDGYAEAMKLQGNMFRAGQRDGTFRAGDPLVVAHLFSALVSAFQRTDLDNGPMPLEQFHEFLDGAFTR
jgi:TetR/AcrR family transcriptional regulator